MFLLCLQKLGTGRRSDRIHRGRGRPATGCRAEKNGLGLRELKEVCVLGFGVYGFGSCVSGLGVYRDIP